jgi:hypothetical protein
MMQHRFEITSDSLKAEMGTPGMWPKMLGHSIARLVSEQPVCGVSPHVHILVCRSGEIFGMTNDETRFPADGSPPIEFKMPSVARTYLEFLTKCHASDLAAEGATASRGGLLSVPHANVADCGDALSCLRNFPKSPVTKNPMT